MADSGGFSGPRDAAVMEAILKEMGVEEYEPNVINQMLEFSYSKCRLTIVQHWNSFIESMSLFGCRETIY